MIVSAFMLLGCGSNDVPSPVERIEQQTASTQEIPIEAVELRPDGLVAGAEAFYFAAGRNEVETALSAAIGDPRERASNDECGAGPVEFTYFAGGLSVHFQEERLVGWNLREPRDGEEADVSVVGEVQIGTDRATTTASAGFDAFDDSTLGEEFSLGPSIGGFFEEDKVSMLYSGTQCFFR